MSERDWRCDKRQTVLFLVVSAAAAGHHDTSVHCVPAHHHQTTDSVPPSQHLPSADTTTALSQPAHFPSVFSVFTHKHTYTSCSHNKKT